MCISLLGLCLTLINYLYLNSLYYYELSLIGLNFFFILYLWLRDIFRESQSGFHTLKVESGLKLGFLIFLITEIMIFFSLFWTYFHSSLNPSIEIVYWPPLLINSVDYLSLPLLNSILLLSGGFLCTWGHHEFILNNKDKSLLLFLIGIILTIIFLFIQNLEYNYNEFTLTDSIYGSIFYALTGLHMIHVLFAVIFLLFAVIRIFKDSITIEHNLILESSLIYYHLVDIIWLILYIILYFWAY